MTTRLRFLACTMLALAALPPQQASAQYLFDRLFGGRIERRQEAPPAPAPAPKRAAAPAPKVAAPSYYKYKADPLVKVDFSVITAALVTDDLTTNSVVDAGAEAAVPLGTPVATPANPFVAALSGLGGYELMAEKDIAAALTSWYSEHPRFIWVRDGQPNHRAAAALEVLRDAASHGLEARDYEVPEIGAAAASGEEAQAAQARFEMAMSAKVLRYVRDASRGRVVANRLSGYHDFAEKPLDYEHILDVLHDTFAVQKYLESWHPQNAQYAALKTELATLRASQENAIVVDPALLLRPGGTSAELPKILQILERDGSAAFKAEFGSLLAASAGREVYSDELVPLIKAAQVAHGLKPDGVIGPRTVAAIAGTSKADRLSKVIVAMEQLRWLPSEFGRRHVFINVPAFNAAYWEDGEEKLSMRTVVGTTATQTFFFQDEIQYVEFHPYWGIPRSILVNKYLPKLYGDPSYLDRIGYEVTDSKGRKIPSAAIDWPSYGSKIPFSVRQPPGPKNSLGEMKIMFPNEHAIYMHDTPEKYLFDRESRAYSNGCIRLQDPRGMAAAVLGWDRARVEERLKGKNGQARLEEKVPVYVSYFTAWPDKAGKVIYSPDVYDRDTRVLTAIQRVDEVRSPAS